MIKYLTGCSNPAVLTVAHKYDIGLMTQPGNGYRAQIEHWPYWAADNGCFSQGNRFNLQKYLDWLSTLPYRDRCLFAVAPDVLNDHALTLQRSLPVLPLIRKLGYPAAFVAQPNCTVTDVPWSAIDCLFIGGDDSWKISDTVTALIQATRLRDIWIHRGRVNSLQRLRDSARSGCDSADGTYLGFGPDKNLPRLLSWLKTIREQPTLPDFMA